jgi:ApaG protein
MSSAVTRGIRVEVAPDYLPERSAPAAHQYLFTYRVTITNEGSETVQLLARLWIITDAEGREERVEGPGVVGETPTLPPGARHVYSSFCPLPTPVGTMEGCYRMVVVPTGERFDVAIGRFTLAVPGAVN